MVLNKATIDFETRSVCSLPDCGAWKYSLDPTTSVLCMAYRMPSWVEGRTGLWHPAFPHVGVKEAKKPVDLFQHVQRGGLIEGHNVAFERAIWANTLKWPSVAPNQWRCSAAKAAAHALPRGLSDAGAALSLSVLKDTEGEKAMKKMSKPRKPVKAERTAWAREHAPCEACGATGKHKVGRAKATPCGACYGSGVDYAITIPSMPVLWHETLDQLVVLWDYCRQDVLAEEALSASLEDLNETETELFELDGQMNERGFQLDMEAVEAALLLLDREFAGLNAELREITHGAVERATQRQRLIAWMEEEGLEIENTQAATIDAYLAPECQTHIPPQVRRTLELLRALGRSSTAKYETMRDWAAPDGRVRGGLLYHGASTGRWTGKGVQPQNFVKGTLKGVEQDDLWRMLKEEAARLL